MEKKRELRTNLFVSPQGLVFIILGFQNDSSLTIKLTFGWKATAHCTGHGGVPLTADPCWDSVPRLPRKLGLIVESSTSENSHSDTFHFRSHFRTTSSQGLLYLTCSPGPQH